MDLLNFRPIGIACGASLMMLASASMGQNLLTNPSFENPQLGAGVEAAGAGTGWSTYNAVYTENTGPGGVNFSPPLPAHDGDQVIKTFGGASGVYEDIPVTVGESFNATAYAMSWSGDPASTGEQGQLLVIFRDTSDANNVSTLVDTILTGPVTNNVWDPGSINSVVPAGVGYVRFQLNTASPGAGSIFYDDTSFSVVTPEPASMGLLAIGGLAVLRRRR